MMYSSRVRRETENAAGFGWQIPEATFDWPTLISAKEKEICRLERAYATNLEPPGAEIVKENAFLVEPNLARHASGGTIKAKYILIATGATANF
jgi:glutathione reductase (NADPH)